MDQDNLDLNRLDGAIRRRRFFRTAGFVVLVLVCCALTPTLFAASGTSATQPPQVIAYVFPQEHILKPSDIDARKLTRINYAFADIKDGRIAEGSGTDAANFATLNALKRENPALKVLISVGGWKGSGGFSNMALTPESRARFIDSVVAFLEKYDLDGLDVDWEYPGLPGAGNRYRPEDKQNYTALLRELRHRFDQVQKKIGRPLYLSIAAGDSTDFLEHTEMNQVQKYVDTVNLMTYDYYVPGSNSMTGNNAPLFTDPADPNHGSADASVRAFEAAGVPASKIVLGVPFYGHAWKDVAETDHGLFQHGKADSDAFTSYGNITSTMLSPAGQAAGYVRYWDAAAEVPYLYNAKERVFVSYDDPESIRLKCDYVKEHHLGGVMFWEYEGDPSGTLLDTIDASLPGPKGAAR